MEGNYKKRIVRIKNTVQTEHTKLLMLQDELDDKIKELSPGKNIGLLGEAYVCLLDTVNSAEDAISVAYYHLRQAEKIINGEK